MMEGMKIMLSTWALMAFTLFLAAPLYYLLKRWAVWCRRHVGGE
jgi:cbb3-type cytochrome oxidase subunit 3